MNKLALLASLSLASCSWFSSNVKPVIDARIDCIKTAEGQVNAGKDAVAIAIEIAGKLGLAAYTAAATGGDVTAALESAALPLIAEYGEPVVACVFKDLAPAPTPASTKKLDLDPVLEVIAHHGWQYK